MRDRGLIHKYSFLVLGLTLSLPVWIQSEIIFLFIAVQIILILYTKSYLSSREILPGLLFMSLYLLGLFSLLYSENLNFGLKKITTQLSLLLIPMLVILTGQNRIKEVSFHFYRGVFFGSVVLIIYLSSGLVFTLLFRDLDFVSSGSISLFDKLLQGYNHRSYIGMVLVAGYLSYHSVLEKDGTGKYKWVSLLYAILVWTILFLSGARSVILAFSLILVIQLYTVLNFRKAIFLSILLVTVFTLFLSFHPRLSSFFRSDLLVTEAFESNARYDLWKGAWKLIKDKPLFGYGLGDGKDVLVESTGHMERIKQLQIRADSHNQFIQSWLGIGVLGPVLLLAILFFYVKRNKDIPLLLRIGFPLLFFLTMFFEVILHRLSGVILFSTLLLFPPAGRQFLRNPRKVLQIALIAIYFFLISFGILRQVVNQFDPKEPSSYMSLDHKEIGYTGLPGKVPDDIPAGTKGCVLDKHSFNKQIEGHLFAQSIINECNAKNGDSVILTAYCFIGESFNGDQVRISGRGQVQEPNDHYADINNKGEWQFLSIRTSAVKGRALFVMTIGKQIISEQDSVSGEVIFAHPSMTILKR